MKYWMGQEWEILSGVRFLIFTGGSLLGDEPSSGATPPLERPKHFGMQNSGVVPNHSHCPVMVTLMSSLREIMGSSQSSGLKQGNNL